MKYVCPICGYVYDEEKEGKPFSELPENWVCPLCGAVKSAFSASAKEEKKQEVHKPVITEDMQELTAGQLAALCSNLARGCEKQYKTAEAEEFRRIADFFTAAAPEEPDDGSRLHTLIRGDLGGLYDYVRTTAAENGDRGTQRICVWGEKVTNILNSLLTRLETEGPGFIEHTNVWVCSVCGFIYVGDTAPELCPVCKVPAWKFDRIEGRA